MRSALMRRVWPGAAGSAERYLDAARLVGPPHHPNQLTWPLRTEDRARIEVRWPTRYEWPPAVNWVSPIRHGMERLVKVIDADVPQLHERMVAFKLRIDGAPHDVILDYSDYPEYDAGLLDEVSLYFKMQCPPDADSRVIPGGYIPRFERIYSYLRRVRRLRDRRRYAFDVHGRFSQSYADAVRRRAVTLLTEQRRFAYEGGLKLVAYSSFLREIAKARICIDLPGNGFLCFRQIDYLAVGSCVIGPRPPVVLPVPLTDRQDIVYAADDLSDLVELCERYLHDDQARESMAARARDYFDRYLHRDQLGAYYLHTALKMLA